MEQWISLNEFMKRYKVGYEVALNMIHNNEIECKKTSGGRYKIKVGGDTVSRELYETEKQKRIEAETTLNLLRQVLVERRENK